MQYTYTATTSFCKRFLTVTCITVSLLLGFAHSASAQAGFSSLFINASPQPLRVCVNSGANNISYLMGVSDGDGFGDYNPGIMTWSPYMLPLHGTLVASDTLVYVFGNLIPTSGFTYTPDPDYTGLDEFKVQVVDTFGNIDTTDVQVVVAAPPTAITGPSVVCAGLTGTLSDSSLYGTWTITSTVASIDPDSGWVSSTGNGTGIVTYSTGCGSDVYDTVNFPSDSNTITGAHSVCGGLSILLSDTTAGGVWTTSSSLIAPITTGGLVTGETPGTATITYTTGCGTPATWTVTVYPPANAGTITGLDNVCVGSGTTLADTATGGYWTSSTTTVATVDSTSGLVTGVTSGTATISYHITTVCGTANAIYSITVNPLAIVSAISGADSVCSGSSITLSDDSTGGTWTATGGFGSVSSSGVFTGSGSGTEIISYSISNPCGTVAATYNVAVHTTPTVSAVTGSTLLCNSSTYTFSDLTAGASWTSTSTSVLTINAVSGIATAMSTGVATVTASYTNTCGTSTATLPVTVTAIPSPGTISGGATVCTGSTLTLTDGATGGSWAASNGKATVSGGIVTGVSAGTDTIIYTVSNICGSANTTQTVNVVAYPTVSVITGSQTQCPPYTYTYTDSILGGSWSASGTALTINSSTGITTELTTGTATITYTHSNFCGTATATLPVTVSAAPDAGSVSGASSVCATTTTTLADGASGGTWSTSNAFATVAGGVVTGVTAGVDTISYTVTNLCGTAVSTHVMTVNPQPIAGTITGLEFLCTGTTETLTDAAPGGTWSSTTTGIASISGSGVVSPVAIGTTIISYTVSNVCNTVAATMPLTVGSTPTAGVITGGGPLCMGSTLSLTETATGGAWTTSASGIATVSGGVVTPVSPGTALISYTTTSTCGSNTATAVITVNPLPDAGTIIGASNLCLLGTDTLTDTASGATWSSSSPSVATVSGGIVTAIGSGTTNIIVIVTNSCGSASTFMTVTVNPLPNAGIITGSSSVCAGATTSLSSSASGGTWSSSAPGTASVSSGLVTGNAPGTAIITYTVVNSCGSDHVTKAVTVNPIPDTASITGPTTLCIGTPATLLDAVSGGVWSSSNSRASVTAGVVSSFAVGIDTISYSVTNTCGTLSAHYVVHIGPDAGVISGSSVVCQGGMITMSETISGGSWNTTNSNAFASGNVISGTVAGLDTITYTTTSVCGSIAATFPITISVGASAGIISGTLSLCPGNVVTLSETQPGGIWSFSNTHATQVSGVVTAASAGRDTLTYTYTNACGTASATSVITINPVLSAGTITGGSTVCVGSSTTLADAAGTGSWLITNTSASISSGVVGGLLAGNDTVYYIASNSCGADTAKRIISVLPVLSAGSISGMSSLCAGSSVTLTDTATTGSWGVTNPAATITSNVITGSYNGTDTVFYATGNSCGADTATFVVTINPLPVAGIITGTSSVCVGSQVTLADPATGGSWSSPGVYDTLSGSIVNGVLAGVDTISYTVTNSCGEATAIYPMTINPLPIAGIITGSDSVCAGAMVTLADTSIGGSWNVQNSNGSISASGVFTGVTAGTDLVTYSVSNVCGTTIAVHLMTINATLSVLSLSGAAAACAGTATTFSATIAGGIWTVSNGNASVNDTSGVVTALTAGTDSIKYTVANQCNSLMAAEVLTIYPAPNAGVISGADSVCKGNTLTLSESVTGGIWTVANTKMFISSTGVATGVTAGTDTIMYSVTNMCGTAVAQYVVAVATAPDATISGGVYVCVNREDTVYGSPTGGVWASTDTNLATITTNGFISGKNAGADTIIYLVANSCGPAVAKLALMVFSSADCPTMVGTVNSINGIKVYPNPSTGLFQMDLPGLGTAEIHVIDLYGKSVYEQMLLSGGVQNVTIDLSGKAKGTYLLSITQNGVTYHEKLVTW